jgi:O-antigen ligase
MFFYILTLLLGLALTIVELPSLAFFPVIIFYFYKSNNLQTNLVLFLLGNSLLGVYLNLNGIPYIVTILFHLILIYLLYKYRIVKSIAKNAFPLIIVLFVLILAQMSSTYNEESLSKLMFILINFLTSLVVFYYTFKNLHLVNLKNLTQSLVVLVLFSYVYSIDLLKLDRLDDLSSFIGYYRQSQSTLKYNLNDALLLNYQFLGYLLNLGLLFLMFSKAFKTSFFILSNIILILLLYTFSRQNLLIHFIIIYANWVLSKSTIQRLTISFVFLLAISPFFYFFLESLEKIDLMASLLESDNILEGSGRDRIFQLGIDSFLSFPLLGIGLSGMAFDGELGVYPHNMIVEILAELGLIGFFIFSLVFVFYKLHYKLYIIRIYGINSMYWYLFLILFIVSFVSGSMIQNIRIFSLLFLPLMFNSTVINTQK